MRTPTSSDIWRAKRKSTGGKKKRCLKGKSCSATCISRNKFCLADLPAGPSSQVPFVRGYIHDMGRDEQAIRRPVRSGDFILPSAPGSGFRKIESEEDFATARSESWRFSKEYHDRMGRVLKVRNKDDDAVAERRKMLQRLGISEEAFAKAIRTVSNYTDLDYKPIKEAMYAALAGAPLSKEMKKELAKAKIIERIIAAAPKEAVPKFRGFRATQETLEDLIASARLKGSFKEGEGVLSSWSTSLGVGREFADKEWEGRPLRIIFQTINKRGMAVESITQAEREMELMTSGTARYTHTGNYRAVPYKGEIYHIFDVIED